MAQERIGMNYRFIVNPETGRKVSIFGKKGREVINNFILQNGGGLPLLIKTLDGRAMILEVTIGDTLQNLFDEVAEELETTTDSIRIVFGGKELFANDLVTKDMVEGTNLHVMMKKVGGGNDNHFPGEFFGNDSGRYSPEPQALGESAYGQQIAVSHGVESVEGMVGPDMGPSPNHSGVQTGGASEFDKIINPKTGRKVSIYGNIGRSVIRNYIKQSMFGGSHDNHLPGEFFGNDSGRYSPEPQALGESAYGQQIAVSHGVESVEGMVGPDMGPSPNHSGVQTGGNMLFGHMVGAEQGSIQLSYNPGDSVHTLVKQIKEKLGAAYEIKIIFMGKEIEPNNLIEGKLLELFNNHGTIHIIVSEAKKGGKGKKELERIKFDKIYARIYTELGSAINDFNRPPPYDDLRFSFNDQGTTKLQQAMKNFPKAPLPDIKNWRGKVTKREEGRQAKIFNYRLNEINETVIMLFNAIFEVEKEYTIDPPATPPTSTQVGSPQLTDKILDFKDQVDERLGQTNDLRDQVNEFRNKSQKGGS